ncbi:MgtC family protein [Skeletonema marinoi]|uniref:MgtC family protein n=1 Tax=Skeletonema marinoi TaxID=267567 RepID=A0AAD9DDM0_9STRA|nr:MgtC family protein [Skeletonema marinoi]
MNKRRHHDDSRSSIGSKAYATCLYSFLIIYTFVFLFGKSLLPPEETWCPYSKLPVRNGYHNPDYNYHPCHHYRGIIGFERRASERPAGIRTMCMVVWLAFKSSTMGWDAARVAAAVPSGVGFLGAGLIWKGNTSTVKNSQQVHGLTTAASVWLAAAVGVAVGGGRRLYIVSVYGVWTAALLCTRVRISTRFDDVVDDDSEIDWDSITDDSSTGLSIDDDGEEDEEEMRRRPESTLWGSGNDINLGYPLSSKNLNDEVEVGDDQEQGINSSWTRLSMSSRHSSAPNLKIYETPIKDEKPPERRRKRRTKKNELRLSFHSYRPNRHAKNRRRAGCHRHRNAAYEDDLGSDESQMNCSWGSRSTHWVGLP